MNRQWKGISTYVVFLILICLVLVFFEGKLQDRPTYSYQQFISEGLKEVFEDINPITDFGGNLSLEFIDFNLNS